MPGYFCCRSFLKIIKEVEKTKYKNYDEMPLMLSVHDLAEVLGISKSSAYVLAKEKGYPTLKIGARVVVPREKFIERINKNISK